MRKYGGTPGETIQTEKKTGKIMNIKSSPEKGRRRLVMTEKSVGRKLYAVDISYKEAKGLERKETYTAEVYEKSRESEYGGMESRFSAGKMKTYLCDEAPEVYRGSGGSQFKSFDSEDRGSFGGGKSKPRVGRTKF